MSVRAHQVLKTVDAVAGYTTYIDLIRPLIRDKQIISTGMTKEVDRVAAAIDLVRTGHSCAIVSSGDPGIYAMAGLVFEMCREKGIELHPLSTCSGKKRNADELYVEVVPGIPALSSGASLLGAPLTHDFAAISLSDLLTPWPVIEKRIEAVAMADFVIVLYNPKSRRRTDQLQKAQEIILRYRDANTPVGIVTRAMRSGQSVVMTSLAQLHSQDVGMLSTVFIGSSASVQYRDFLFTPRGYGNKYRLD